MYDFEFFKNQKTLTMENYYEIMRFYKLRYNSEYPVFYHCMPEYNSGISSKQFKYVIFDIEEDKVFVAYKVITIMTTKQIRLFDAPISLNRNSEHEKQILDKLISISFVKVAFKQNTKYLKEDVPLVEYDDYYLDFASHKLSNRYMNMFNKCDAFRIEIKDKLSHLDIEELIKLREIWSTYLNVSKSSFKEFKNILCNHTDGIKFVIMYYKDKPITVEIILVTALGYANMLFEIKTRERICDTSIEQKFLDYGVAKVRNIYIKQMLENKGITRLYLAGCRPTEKRLLKHKKAISDGCIKYYLSANEV